MIIILKFGLLNVINFVFVGVYKSRLFKANKLKLYLPVVA